MSRRLRPRRTRWAAAAVAVLAMVGGGVYAAFPAQAASLLTDGFEGNPYARWAVTETPGDSYVWLGELNKPHTGSNAAYFFAPYDVVGRATWSIHVDRPGSGPVTCFADAMVRRDRVIRGVSWSESTPRVRMRIRAGGPSGTIIKSAYVDLTNTDWAHVTYSTWAYGQADLTVDITVTNGMAYVDDVGVGCNTQPR